MLKAGMSNCSTSGILFDPRESADVLETGMSTRSSTATAPLRPYSPHEEPNPPPAVQSNPMSDPPPPYAPQHDSSTQLRSTTSRTRSTDRFHLIPSIQPNADYTVMNQSLCCLVFCLLICNPFSILFTLPAVICAWHSVKLSLRNKFLSAKKLAKMSRIMMVITIAQYICIMIIAIIVIIIYFLLENNQFQIKGIHY